MVPVMHECRAGRLLGRVDEHIPRSGRFARASGAGRRRDTDEAGQSPSGRSSTWCGPGRRSSAPGSAAYPSCAAARSRSWDVHRRSAALIATRARSGVERSRTTAPATRSRSPWRSVKSILVIPSRSVHPSLTAHSLRAQSRTNASGSSPRASQARSAAVATLPTTASIAAIDSSTSTATAAGAAAAATCARVCDQLTWTSVRPSTAGRPPAPRTPLRQADLGRSYTEQAPDDHRGQRLSRDRGATVARISQTREPRDDGIGGDEPRLSGRQRLHRRGTPDAHALRAQRPRAHAPPLSGRPGRRRAQHHLQRRHRVSRRTLPRAVTPRHPRPPARPRPRSPGTLGWRRP